MHLVVYPQKRPFKGSVPVPPDSRIAQVALVLAALSNGASTIRGYEPLLEPLPLLRALRALGVRYTDDERGTLTVHGVGLKGLQALNEPIDCESSLSALSLLLGLSAGQPFSTWLVGSPELTRTGIGHWVRPLRERGASIIGESHAGRAHEVFLPIEVGPLGVGERLRPSEHRMAVVDPLAKGALLVSGLFASGPTWVHEPLVSPDHVERLLLALGMPVETVGPMVSLHPPADPQAIGAFELELVGDISLAAYLLALGAVVEGSAVNTRRTGLNPTRAGVLELFRAFGSRVGISPKGEAMGEPFGEVAARGNPLRAARLEGELAVRVLDDLPVGCILAARASGSSVFGELATIRERNPGFAEALVKMLLAFGLTAKLDASELSIEGQPFDALRAAEVDAAGDARLAMAASVLALLAEDRCVIDNVDSLSGKFPRFVGTLRALGAQIEVIR